MIEKIDELLLSQRRNLLMNELDLEPIVVKALDPEEGYGWSLDYALKVADEYRKYLILCLENQDLPIVPSTCVDEFWHLHILDTMKYQEDCQKYFGYFLHHFPYFGMRGEEDAKNLLESWTATRELYVKTFGDLPETYWPISNRCPNCGKRCRDDKKGVFLENRPTLSDLKLPTLA